MFVHRITRPYLHHCSLRVRYQHSSHRVPIPRVLFRVQHLIETKKERERGCILLYFHTIPALHRAHWHQLHQGLRRHPKEKRVFNNIGCKRWVYTEQCCSDWGSPQFSGRVSSWHAENSRFNPRHFQASNSNPTLTPTGINISEGIYRKWDVFSRCQKGNREGACLICNGREF